MSTDTQQDAREQARHKASVMIAFDEGKIVRFRDRVCRGEWRIMSSDQTWDWALYEFEVKPEERKQWELTVIVKDGQINQSVLLPDGEYVMREVLPETETES